MANQEKDITVGKLKWFYREATPMNPTTKPPVVLLHGLPAQSYGWRHVLPALAEQGFWAIAPDWIGFGFSAQPDRRDFSYTPDAYVEALAAFLTALDIEKCSLVVQGFLGSVGLLYALKYPDRVDRIAILNAPITAEAKLPWKIKQMGIPLVGDMMTQDPLLVDRTLEGGGGYRVEDADLDVYRRPYLKSSDAGRALLAVIQNLQIPKTSVAIQEGFKAWQSPVLVAWGMRDPWLSFSLAQSFAQTVPHAELAELEEVGHYPQEDWHEKVNDALIAFLRRQML